MRAIVIDDSKAMRRILTNMLTELGFDTIYEAGDGKEAIEVIQKAEKIDIALVDWNMPGMNGYQLVQALRKDDKYDPMTLMMVTTETDMSQVVKALAAGANEYVMKPFTKDVIIDKLKLLGLLAA